MNFSSKAWDKMTIKFLITCSYINILLFCLVCPTIVNNQGVSGCLGHNESYGTFGYPGCVSQLWGRICKSGSQTRRWESNAWSPQSHRLCDKRRRETVTWAKTPVTPFGRKELFIWHCEAKRGCLHLCVYPLPHCAPEHSISLLAHFTD